MGPKAQPPLPMLLPRDPTPSAMPSLVMKASSKSDSAREKPRSRKLRRLARLNARLDVTLDVTLDVILDQSVEDVEASVEVTAVSETEMRATMVVTFLKLAATWERSLLLLPRATRRRSSKPSPRLFKRSLPLFPWVTSIPP